SRVGDNDGRFWDGGDHATTHAQLPYLLHLPFDGRVTFRLFEFFFELADRHFLPLVPLPILEKVVGGSYDCEHCNDRTQQLECQGQGQWREARQVAARERFESFAFGPHEHCQHTADQGQLDETLA